MVLGVDKLLDLVKTDKLVVGLCERELTNPEGAGFDLRLGKVFSLSGKGFMGLEERSTPESTLIAEFNAKRKTLIVLKPGDSYLVSIQEKVNIPSNITALMTLRSTFYRSGIIMQGGNIAPGYSGEMSFLLYNAGPCEFEIELGSRIVHIVFWEVAGKTNMYRGQWKGGRVSAIKKEKQV